MRKKNLEFEEFEKKLNRNLINSCFVKWPKSPYCFLSLSFIFDENYDRDIAVEDHSQTVLYLRSSNATKWSPVRPISTRFGKFELTTK